MQVHAQASTALGAASGRQRCCRARQAQVQRRHAGAAGAPATACCITVAQKAPLAPSAQLARALPAAWHCPTWHPTVALLRAASNPQAHKPHPTLPQVSDTTILATMYRKEGDWDMAWDPDIAFVTSKDFFKSFNTGGGWAAVSVCVCVCLCVCVWGGLLHGWVAADQ